MFDNLKNLLAVTSIKNPDEDLLCRICKKIMVDASQSLCGCRFCRACIMTYLNNGGHGCPIRDNEDCGLVSVESMEDVHPENETNRRIWMLTVKCPIIGCNVEGTVKEMELHVKECRRINGDEIPMINEENKKNKKPCVREEVNKLEGNVKNEFDSLRLLIDRFNKRIDSLEKHMVGDTSRLESLLIRVDNIEKILNKEKNDDFIWKITNFSLKKTKKEHIYSDCFYTRKNGYNLQLLFYPNGDDGYGTHLSLYFKIVKGEYDDVLQWPFKYNVTLSVMDQEGSFRDFNETLKYTESKAYVDIYKKPTISENRSHGKSQFLSISEFQVKPYLFKNDTIFLKLSVSKC